MLPSAVTQQTPCTVIVKVPEYTSIKCSATLDRDLNATLEFLELSSPTVRQARANAWGEDDHWIELELLLELCHFIEASNSHFGFFGHC